MASKQLITPGSGVVNALDPATGQEIWQRPLWRRLFGDSQAAVWPRHALHRHGLQRTDRHGDSAGRQGDVTDTHVAWTVKKGAPHTPSLLLVGDELYMVTDKTGIATCVDAHKGKEHWQERIGGNYSASPIYADGKIYIQSEEGPALVSKPGKTFHKARRRRHSKSGRWPRTPSATTAFLFAPRRTLYRVTDVRSMNDYRLLGRTGCSRLAAVPGHDDVRRADERGRFDSHHSQGASMRGSTSSIRPTCITPANRSGSSARRLQDRRDSVVLATKGRNKMGEGPNDWGASRLHMRQALDASLRRLDTDHIDLYYIHAPDYDTPIDETLRFLDDAVRQGKILYPACSNFRAWRVVRVAVDERQAGPGPVCRRAAAL